MVVARDARGSTLESVYVHMCACRSAGISQVIPCARRSETESGPDHPSSTTPWEVLDSISVSDVFKNLAASNEDVTKETRLLPFWLLRRPQSQRSCWQSRVDQTI